ncbi:uncharacterized protein KLLA0_D07788g [Kluyveromyces lactis]|uniref:KLLA0D07788p n=1 Tax=Kluyveromyces lactis (strain ATCC 8585 / CBS 2359 / DSM 70799 / NBRC 1267 / NRRL Y-1140 / WM37) TaxID=284590 RepID=Q6CRM9_KLULA|nr:uncharacterized protein KLLA0_D07788g [Kluyveromyces lactis]CAH00506.1 KLLA0D07788p [Kluyveromyces lactis]|eukprot:XP_453410.1 uncharacterized protein KLLA0_D07788g [Kluyveromyces lactis]
MTRNGYVLLLSLACVFTTTYGLIQCTQIKLPSNLATAGHKQFLTNISAVVTIVNGALNTVNQLLGNKGTLHFWSREFTFPIATCLETIVCVIYWPLRIFFIPLIMHGVQDSSRSPLPMHVDIAIHLLPIIYLCLDYFFLKEAPFQIAGWKVFLSLPLLGLTYRIYLDSIIGPSGSYPYPFLDVPEPYKSVIFVTVSLSSGGLYILYQKFHRNQRSVSLKRD